MALGGLEGVLCMVAFITQPVFSGSVYNWYDPTKGIDVPRAALPALSAADSTHRRNRA